MEVKGYGGGGQRGVGGRRRGKGMGIKGHRGGEVGWGGTVGVKGDGGQRDVEGRGWVKGARGGE